MIKEVLKISKKQKYMEHHGKHSKETNPLHLGTSNLATVVASSIEN
jgi:hypothetical protein